MILKIWKHILWSMDILYDIENNELIDEVIIKLYERT